MKKFILTIVIALFAYSAFAGELTTLAADAANEVVSIYNIDTTNKNKNSAYAEVGEFKLFYSASAEYAFILVMDAENNTLEEASFEAGTPEYQKISAALYYAEERKNTLLASIR